MTDVVVLTGFLGSGKTTLLRDFLGRAEAADTAVIRPATDRARTIPDLTNIPDPPIPLVCLRAEQAQRSRPYTARSGTAGRRYKRMGCSS